MKYIVFLLSAFIFAFPILSGQGYLLRGYVLHEGSDAPISDINVTMLGGDKTQTDTYGTFALIIPTAFKAGDDIEIVLYDKEYGFHKITYRMNGNKQQTTTIKIKRNTNVGVVGTVRDAQTKSFIKGLRVSVLSNTLNKNVPPVVTNEFGIFSISIPKNDFNNFNDHLDLLIQDPSGKYIDFRETRNILAPLELELTPKPPSIKTLKEKLERQKTIILDVRKGGLIKVNASGSIKVGSIVGNSTPNGRESGLFGASITQYNLVPSFNHAALMYKLDGDTEWRFCGSNCQFKSERNGKLSVIFEINDNDQDNNSGAYDLSITIEQ